MKLGVVFHCRAERRSAQAERGSAPHYTLSQFQIVLEDVEQLIREAGAQLMATKASLQHLLRRRRRGVR